MTYHRPIQWWGLHMASAKGLIAFMVSTLVLIVLLANRSRIISCDMQQGLQGPGVMSSLKAACGERP